MATPRARDDVDYYVRAADRAPKLDRELETQLVQRWHAGDDKAKLELVRSHQRYVVALAVKYRRYGVPIGDLIAEGNLGVVHALAKFQPERGVRFGTYAAYWVRAEMLALVIRAHRTVGGFGGALRTQMFFKLRRERARVYNLWGSGEAADRELAARIGVSVHRLGALNARLDARDVALDAPVAHGRGTPMDQLAAPHDQEQELCELEVAVHLRDAIGAALTGLDRREREIVEHRYLAEAGHELSLAELARRMGVSRERARQLETRALTKLRRSISASPNHVVREWVETESLAVDVVVPTALP
jgi:RNA polymerase sigma-32 factor